MEEYVKRGFPNMNHHFTMAYTPWSNGSVERVMRDIIILFRRLVLNSDTVFFDSWPFLLPHIMSTLNGRKQLGLSNRSPRELVTSRYDDSTLDILFDPLLDQIKGVFNANSHSEHYDNLFTSLEIMHREIPIAQERIIHRNKKHQHVCKPVDFGVGDFVLVAIANKNMLRKLQAFWRGPYRVVSCNSSHVYTCEDLTLNITLDVHVTRMKFFATSDMDVTIPLRNVIKAQDSWNFRYIPEVILDTRVDLNKDLYLQIKWNGFSELETTWELAKTFFHDCPHLVHEFLLAHQNNHSELRKFVAVQIAEKNRLEKLRLEKLQKKFSK
jgi:hypothetical protein